MELYLFGLFLKQPFLNLFFPANYGPTFLLSFEVNTFKTAVFIQCLYFLIFNDSDSVFFYYHIENAETVTAWSPSHFGS